MSSRNQAITVHPSNIKFIANNGENTNNAPQQANKLESATTPEQQQQSFEAHRDSHIDQFMIVDGSNSITSSANTHLTNGAISKQQQAQQDSTRPNPLTPPLTQSSQHSWTTSDSSHAVQQIDQMITADNESTSPYLAGSRSRRIRFKSLLTPSVISESDEVNQIDDNNSRLNSSGQELIDLTSFSASSATPKIAHSDTTGAHSGIRHNNGSNRKISQQTARAYQHITPQTLLNETIPEEDNSINQDHQTDSDDVDSDEEDNHNEGNFFDDDYDRDPDKLTDDDYVDNYVVGDLRLTTNGTNQIAASPSHHKLKARNTFASRLYHRLSYLTSDLKEKLYPSSSSTIAYTAYEQDSRTKTSLTGAREYRRLKKAPKRKSPEQSFRGNYRYSRIGIVMTVFKKLLSFLIQRSTLALFGAFLIHVTLGTIYTLSNINSYLTSYMRKHGTPNATYGGSMWISSSYAVGQGLSMILGGLIEKRFSARVSCILGCVLHSMAIMSTSRSIDHGQLAVLLTYGFLPGFGCGLAYMTPMSNGFGWFPHRKGLVAGTILAGFGIGTFVFNTAQTAYVNPHNLSPLPADDNYFTQDEILDNVPRLFIFLGSIYACMQFVGCCLLFKPPDQSTSDGYIKGTIPSDERPILAEANDMSFKRAIKTREFFVLFLVFGITNQGVLFVNSMLKEYGQIFIKDDLYLAWTGSMASIANSLGRLIWGMAIDKYSFTVCFTLITTIFGTLIFMMPFEFILSSKLLYLLCTLGIFGSFSGWMSTYPVHLSRIFGTRNSGMIYGLIFVSQSIGGIMTAFAAHYLIDHYGRFVPFFCVTFLEVLGLSIYHLFYSK